MRLIERVIKSWKVRTDDLWKQQEADLRRLGAENEEVGDAARSFEALCQTTYRGFLRCEGRTLEAMDDEGLTRDEELRLEGELRAYRMGQVMMEIAGRSLGIHMHKPNN